MILSSSTSVNELYNPERVFTFDEDNVYSQSPLVVSTGVEESRPGYLQRDHSFVREVAGEIEAEKVEVIDNYTCMLLRQIKREANLSEVEYGKLLMHIECGEVDDVCEVLEAALESYGHTLFFSVDRTSRPSTRSSILSKTSWWNLELSKTKMIGWIPRLLCMSRLLRSASPILEFSKRAERMNMKTPSSRLLLSESTLWRSACVGVE